MLLPPTTRFAILLSGAVTFATGAMAQEEIVVYSFNYDASVYAHLYEDTTGTIYGTESSGPGTYGAVFRLVAHKGVWHEQTIFKFDKTDGAHPMGAVVEDSSGTIYGTTEKGGYGPGTAFSLAPPTGKSWTETILHDFTGGNDGNMPEGSVLIGKTGGFFGTTSAGGQSN